MEFEQNFYINIKSSNDLVPFITMKLKKREI